MVQQIGKIEKVPLREIWKREDHGFTRWLAENIDHLNRVIGFDITVISIEESVGPYKVDLYCEDAQGNKVIIENQLEKTDHSHLGQILTYIVNLEGTTAIWIASTPNEEHARVIEWLNTTTPDNISFYLIQLEAIKIAGQDIVAPLFTVIEGPSREKKEIGAEQKEFSKRHTLTKQFWTQLLEQMSKKTKLANNVTPSTYSWIRLWRGMTGVHLTMVISREYARVEIYITRGDKEDNKRIFDLFYQSKEQIEKEFGDSLVWERLDEKVASRIKYQLDGVDAFNETDWPTMTEFLIENTITLHKVFAENMREVWGQ
jgi:hypothetical protein